MEIAETSDMEPAEERDIVICESRVVDEEEEVIVVSEDRVVDDVYCVDGFEIHDPVYFMNLKGVNVLATYGIHSFSRPNLNLDMS